MQWERARYDLRSWLVIVYSLSMQVFVYIDMEFVISLKIESYCQTKRMEPKVTVLLKSFNEPANC